MHPKHPEICRYCGGRVHFTTVEDSAAPWKKPRWLILNADGLSRHQCPRTAAKVYTEEEKREFARKREAGEI